MPPHLLSHMLQNKYGQMLSHLSQLADHNSVMNATQTTSQPTTIASNLQAQASSGAHALTPQASLYMDPASSQSNQERERPQDRPPRKEKVKKGKNRPTHLNPDGLSKATRKRLTRYARARDDNPESFRLPRFNNVAEQRWFDGVVEREGLYGSTWKPFRPNQQDGAAYQPQPATRAPRIKVEEEEGRMDMETLAQNGTSMGSQNTQFRHHGLGGADVGYNATAGLTGASHAPALSRSDGKSRVTAQSSEAIHPDRMAIINAAAQGPSSPHPTSPYLDMFKQYTEVNSGHQGNMSESHQVFDTDAVDWSYSQSYGHDYRQDQHYGPSERDDSQRPRYKRNCASQNESHPSGHVSLPSSCRKHGTRWLKPPRWQKCPLPSPEFASQTSDHHHHDPYQRHDATNVDLEYPRRHQLPNFSRTTPNRRKDASVTDLYLYLDANHYDKYHDLIKSVNARACATGLRIWALEGGRVYFSDADGPAHFYKGIRNMIDFNAQVEAHERFVGFSADLEPYAKGHCGSFHNGIKTSELTCEVGTGVWKASQAEDRAALLRDWIEIHDTAKGMLRDAGLLFAAAFPHWIGDYCGEALQMRWPTDDAALMPVMDALMVCVDYYVVMSYHVDPKVAATRVIRELECANQMGRCNPGRCPKVLAAVETTKGIGSKISYGDEPSKCSKKVVVDDAEAITATLGHHESFGGVAIHAWAGWCCLTD
ncbi:hypothetical protein M409DRAFT_51555 [Zasmidium cellare ATCC 36951]|uniref:Uncharacterized protein n=1 Tax=Zasmidium cellare ATCC 36951 TaxID=1080233 RepID=A0A6A6CTE1_ZASCE|nr:uncharacterized protein M409DRAFT_51555 [Zasmidium cellare ATCC 36951]KAF2170527.1 hypothetical protein M409DRAFT_51555 [Zasmidium cellare ATCC 36951]